MPSTRSLPRHRATALAGVALALAVLAGCSSTAPVPDDAPTAAVRTIDTPMGPVDVPESPQRVVSIDAYVGLQALDELGAPVVAAGTLGGGLRTLVSDEAQDLPSVGVTAELQLEAIAAAEPDLIVGRQPIGEQYYDELSSIAPTVLIPFEYWRDQYVGVADAVGLADEATENLSTLDDEIAELRADVAEAWPDGVDLSVVRVSDTSGDVRTYNTLDASTTFVYADILSGAGITPTANSLPDADPATVNSSVSGENLALVDGDVIVYYVGAGGQADAGETVEQALTTNQLWPALSAVQEGQAFRVDSAPWFDAYNLAGARAVIDDLRRVLL